MAVHILGLVQILDIALDAHRVHLFFAGLLAGALGELIVLPVDPVRRGPQQHLAQNTVDGQVGVTADGAGEVGIVPQDQAVMPQRLGRIARLLHAAQDAGVHRRLDGLPAGGVQQGGQFQLGGDGVLELGVQPAGQQRGREFFHLLGIGRFMHAVDERHLVGAARVGRALVGQQHEFLDHALRRAAPALDDVHTAAVLVNDQLGLVGLDLHSPALAAQFQPLAVQLVHQGQLVQHVGVFFPQRGQAGPLFGFQQGVDLLIHTLDPAADDRFDKVVAMDLALRVQPHQAGERQPVLLRVQGTDAVGELGGQHGDDLVGIVDAGGPFVGFFIQCRTGAHIVAHIRNVHAQFIAAFLQLLQADGVVDVLGLGGVDGKNGDGAQVHAVGGFRRVDGCAVIGMGLGQHLGREFLPHIAAVEDGPGALRRILGGAELFHHGGTVLAVALAPVGDLDAHLVAQMHALAALFGQQELHVPAAVGLHGQPSVVRQADRAGEMVVGGGDLHHFPFRGALHPRAVKQFDQDLVLRHGAVQRPARDEDIALAVVPAGEAEAGGQLDQRAGQRGRVGRVFIGGKARRISAVAHRQVAGGHHGGNGGAQAGIVHLQVVLQFAQRHGTMPDRIEDAFLQRCHKITPSFTSLRRPAQPFPCGATPRHFPTKNGPPGRRSYLRRAGRTLFVL